MFSVMRVLTAAVVSLLLASCVTDGDQLVDRPEAARANTELGLAYLQQGRLDRAEATLQRAIELNDGIASAHAGLGVIYMQQGELRKAGLRYRRALAIEPDNPETQNQFGVLLCEQQSYAEALPLLASVVENRSYRTPEVAATNAGICAQSAGDLLSSRRWFNKALQSNSRHAPALLELARLNLKADDVAAAAGLIERYLRLKPLSRSGLQLGLETARRSGNAWAADQYARKLASLAKQQKAPDGQPE